jgi:hypothetical protein
MKIVYLYNDLGFYTGEYEVQESPLEPGSFLTPELSTDISPKAQLIEGHSAKFNGVFWVAIPDSRGTVYDTDTGSSSEYKIIGDLPANLTKIPRPTAQHKFVNGAWALDLELVKEKQITELYKSYNEAIQTDIAYMNTTFNADDATQLLIVKVLSAGQVPAGFFWQDINNNQIPMIYSQAQGFAGTILTRAQLAFVRLQVLKAQIRAATDINAAQQIIWN